MNPYWTRTLEHVVSEGWIDRRLLRDVRDLRRGGRRAGRLCHRTLTALQNYYSKSLKNQDAALAMAAPAFQTPYTFLSPNKTSDAVAPVTVVLPVGR